MNFEFVQIKFSSTEYSCKVAHKVWNFPDDRKHDFFVKNVHKKT